MAPPASTPRPPGPPDRFTQTILVVRGQKVMLDATLAALYGVPTSRLNEQTRRDRERFPQHFMLQLTEAEFSALRTQVAPSKTGRRLHRSYLPYVYTEHGAIMAATVLNSPQAVEVAIYFVRAVVQLQDMLGSHPAFGKRLEDLERAAASDDPTIASMIGAIRKYYRRDARADETGVVPKQAPDLEQPARRESLRPQTVISKTDRDGERLIALKRKPIKSVVRDADVFYDAHELYVRTQIGRYVCDILKGQKRKQRDLAEIMGLKQGHVSHLMSGDFTRFTTYRLLGFLNRLNRTVTIKIAPHKAGEPYQLVALISTLGKVDTVSGNDIASSDIPSPGDAVDELYVRTQIGRYVCDILKGANLKERDIVRVLAIRKPRALLLMNEDFNRFTTDKLLGFLKRLDRTVTIEITPHKAGEAYQQVALM